MHIKKLAAGAMGLLMVGSTVFAAGSLASLPQPFVSSTGTVSTLVVVGTDAKPSDVVGAIDVAARLGSESTTSYTCAGTTSDISVTGGTAFRVKQATNALEMSEALNSPVDVVTKDNLAILAGGSLTPTGYTTAKYSEYIELPSTASVGFVKDTTSSENEPKLHLNFTASQAAYTYKMVFGTAAKSDKDTSTNRLTDMEGKSITMLGKSYGIVKAYNATGLELTLMGGESSATVNHGESQDFVVKDVTYTVTPYIYSGTEVRFDVKYSGNTKSTNKLNAGDTYALPDKTEVGVDTIFYSAKTGVTSSVKFYVGAEKVVIKDTNILDGAYLENGLTVGTNTINNVYVKITGTDTSTTMSLNSIEIQWKPTNTVFVEKGETLIGKQESGEAGQVFLEGFSIDFQGLVTGTTEDIKVSPVSDNEYKMTFKNKNGDTYTVPLYYNSTLNSKVGFGEYGGGTTRFLHYTDNELIKDEDMFVVSKSKYTRVLRYKSINPTDNTVSFRDEGTGDTIEVSYSGAATTVDGTSDGTLYLDGYAYVFDVADTTNGDIKVDLNADTNFDGDTVEIYTKGEANITLLSTLNGFQLQTEKMEDGTTKDTLSAQIYYDSTNSRLNVVSGNFTGLRWALDTVGDLQKKRGYSKYGVFVEYNYPTGTQADFKMVYPDNQAVAAVFVSNGKATYSATDAATGAAVKKAVAVTSSIAKLDTEVTTADKTEKNIVLVGGPCVNDIVMDLLKTNWGVKDACTEWLKKYSAGESIIQLIDDAFGTGKAALIIAGTDAADTLEATSVFQKYDTKSLSGTKVKIKSGVISTETA